MCDKGDLNTESLEIALDSAFQFGLDEEEDSNHRRVKDHFHKVIEYLEGRTNGL